jgi:hypothetical protein
MEIVLFGVATYLILNSGPSFIRKKLTLIYMACSLALTTIWYIAGVRWTAYMLAGNFRHGASCSAVVLTMKVMAMLQFLSSDVLLVRTTPLYTYPFHDPNKRVGISCVHDMEQRLACSVHTRGALRNKPRSEYFHFYKYTRLVLFLFVVFGIITVLHCVSNIDMPILHHLFLIITVIINVLSTSAIAWKLLRQRRFLHRSNKIHDSLASRANGVVMILAESAVLYSVLGLVVISTFWYKTPASSFLGTAFQCMAVSACMGRTNVTEHVVQFLNPAATILYISINAWMREHSPSMCSSHSTQRIQARTVQDPTVSSPPFRLAIPISGIDGIRPIEVLSSNKQLHSLTKNEDKV